MSGTVQYEKYQDIALLNIQNPPVNALGSGVRLGLHEGLNTAFSDETIKAIILYSEGKIFISGADISEFGKPMAHPILSEVLDLMEQSPKPIIAAINGTAFGGGLETALCCDYRIAYRDASLGLPEVKLGLLPGAGGTQRLPRLVGLERAMMMILSGDPISGDQAHQTGLIDRVVDTHLLDHAKEYAKEIILQGALLNKVSQKSVTIDSHSLNLLIEKSNDWINTYRYNQFAPTMIVECVQLAAQSKSLSDGLKGERARFLKCLEHPQRAAMIHGFFSERQASKHPNIDKHTKIIPIKTIAIIGAGTMGQGIAEALLLHHYTVIAVDQNQEALATVQNNIQFNLAKKQLTQAQINGFLANIQYSSSLQDISNVDLVIESIAENTESKNQLFLTLDQICCENTLFTSNTSSLDINNIFNLRNQGRQVAGLHFFNPANKTRLVELIPGRDTSTQTLASLQNLSKKLGKISIFSNNVPGFIVNRMLIDLIDACLLLVAQGTSFEKIDTILTQFGFAIGPFKTCDLVGLDIVAKVHRELIGANALGGQLLQQLVENSQLGRKSNAGFYTYDTPPVKANDQAIAICTQFKPELTHTQSLTDPQEILDYCLAVLANSGTELIQDKTSYKSSDIDIASIYGFGFPVFTGGLMYHAQNMGAHKIITTLEKHQSLGRLDYPPCALLYEQAKQHR